MAKNYRRKQKTQSVRAMAGDYIYAVGWLYGRRLQLGSRMSDISQEEGFFAGEPLLSWKMRFL